MLGLARGGYPLEICRQVLLSVENNEFLAAEKLFNHLLRITFDNGNTEANGTDSTDVWIEEQTPLKEIYSSRFTILNPTTCRIQLSPSSSNILPKTVSVEFQKSADYPHSLPPHLVVLSEPKLPAHVRLSLIRQAGLYAWESLRGMGMVYGLADWIEENMERIVKNPGRLSDLEGVVSGEEMHVVHESKAQKFLYPKRKQIDWTPRTIVDEVSVSPSRKTLPAWKHRDQIVSVVRNNRVIVVTGETGSGKSTQIPQFLLDDLTCRGLSHAVDIVCTQPRRISAIGLADRVSEERGEKVGMSVGYSIRGESKSSHATKLRFVTTGVLLRRFLDDPELGGVSHVIVDEVHERTVDGDFLLLLLKQLLLRRKDLTVILMSATVEADEYAQYFAEYTVGRVHVEGRTFPVQDIHLEWILSTTGYRPPLRKLRRERDSESEDFESSIGSALNILNEGILDYELIASTVKLICDENKDSGGVLIFLPGTNPVMCTKLISRNRRDFPMHYFDQ
jgi:ATP-dependent RNA helicase DHX57